jgi:hypothetical protein
MERADLFKAVDDHLARLDATLQAPASARYGAFHAAAAVLHTFDEGLQPAPVPGPAETLDDVLGNSTAMQVGAGEWRYELDADVRRAVLRQLGNRAAMISARAANRDVRSDAVQEALDAWIGGTARPIAEQSERELAASFEVAGWLHGIMEGVPDQATLRAALDRIYLLAPFEGLVKKNFAGRKDELTVLKEYVGVLPGTAWSWLRQRAAEVVSWHEKPPLVIHGPGGIGKSTLVGKFVLEHAEIEDDKRFPFVYLDFDRADLLAAEPLTILLEAVRQIGIQWPSLRSECDALRRRWTQQIVRAQQRPSNDVGGNAQQVPSVVADWAMFLGDFERFMARPEIAGRPVLLVLDTFEEVQSRSQAVVERITHFLEDLQRAVPRLRTVFSGRAALDDPAAAQSLPRAQSMPLSQLDPESAASILRLEGMPEPLASKTASWVGGHPLVLQLACELLQRLQQQHGNETGLALFEADAARAQLESGGAQRFLYTRILDHIRNADARVADIAHPGLVLRRLTPELILNVLAQPCGVQVADLADAEQLLNSLSSEVALVTSIGPREVRHRSDLRKLMLKAMTADPETQPVIRRIHELAVGYYEKEHERTHAPSDRAEELYHRLALDQPTETLDARWLDVVQPLLFTVLDELPASARAWLSARLRVELDPEARAAASTEVWERDAERRVQELLVFNQPERALEVMRERDARTPASPLFVLEARALEASGQPDAALDIVDAAIDQTFRAGADAVRFDVLLVGAEIDRRRGNLAECTRRLELAEVLAAQRGDALSQLRAAGARLALFDAEPSSESTSAREVVATTAAQRIDRLTDRELMLAPESARLVAAELVHTNLPVVRRVVRVVGLGTIDLTRLNDLARALERWDAELAAAQPDGSRAINTVALQKVLEQSYSHEQLESLFRRARRRSRAEIPSESIPKESTAPAQTVIALFDHAGALPQLVEAMEQDRPGVAAAAFRSAGPVGRLFDLQNAPDGTIASLILEAPSLAPAALDRVLEQLPPPPPVRAALAAVLRPTEETDEAHAPATQSANIELTTTTRLNLEEALLQAFPSYTRLRVMLYVGVGINLESIASAGKPLGQVVTDLMQWAIAAGRVAEVMSAAGRANPTNPRLRAAMADLGLTPELEAATPGALDRVRAYTSGSAAPSIDPATWRQHLAELEGLVCLVSVASGDAPPVLGSGFLVAPDVVLTSRVLVGNGSRAPITGWCLFDHREVAGNVVDAGTRCPLATTAIVDEDESGEYALLKLIRAIGLEPTGATRALPGTRARGWLVLPFEPSPQEDLVAVLHATATGRLKGALGHDARLRGASLEYRVTSEPAASGAPVFDLQFRLVAIHQGRGASWLWNVKRGTSIAHVVERLRAKRVFDTLPRDVPSRDDLAL